MADTARPKPRREPLRAAIIYDFDGTLARGNLQERSFIPDIAGMKHADFWMEVKRLAKAEDADEILDRAPLHACRDFLGQEFEQQLAGHRAAA